MMEGLEWTVVAINGIRHVTPNDDTFPHNLASDCWCGPSTDDDAPSVMVHNSADGREAFETGQRKLS